MVFPELAHFADPSLLLLRLMLAAVFATSGWSHVRDPRERGESIGMPPAVTAVLGAIEIAGAASIALGVYAQIGGLLLIGVMLGAIGKKIFVWKTGFWGDGSGGWYYDLLYLVGNLVIVTTGGGGWTLT